MTRKRRPPTPPPAQAPPPSNVNWRPGWVKLSTRVAYGWGLMIGTANFLWIRDPPTYAWSGALITLGMGLSAAASKVFQRPGS